MFSSFAPLKRYTPRVTISDLPFDILEEILFLALLSPPSSPSQPPGSLPNPPSSRSRTSCLRTNKAFNSAGEKGLFDTIVVSRRSSWVTLFGVDGLLSVSRGRDLARFVKVLSLDGTGDWLWGQDGHKEPRADPLMISPILSPFPRLASLILHPSIIADLDYPTHIHPLDQLIPQLRPSRPFTLTLVTHHRFASSKSRYRMRHPLPLRYILLHSHSERNRRISRLRKFLLRSGEPVYLPFELPFRQFLHQALGFTSPPWSTFLDTFIFVGNPLEEGPRPHRGQGDGQQLKALAGSSWSFRRLVFVLPSRLVAPPGRPVQDYTSGTELLWLLLHRRRLPQSFNGRIRDRLERIELRIGTEREEEIREVWRVESTTGRYSAERKRLAGMIWFMDEEEEEGSEGRRLVEE